MRRARPKAPTTQDDGDGPAPDEYFNTFYDAQGREYHVRNYDNTAEPAPHPQAMAVGTLNLRIRDVVKAAGITGDKVGPHTFRHTFATMYLRAGGDLHRLQRLMGHTSIKQTMVYLHLADPEAFEEHARLSPLNQLRRAN